MIEKATNTIISYSLKSSGINFTWWPSQNSKTTFTPLTSRQSSISYHKGCLLWGSRVIISSSLRHQALKLLHTGHEGIVQTKALARSYFWWPKLDADIEEVIRSCHLCQQSWHNPLKSILIPWEKTTLVKTSCRFCGSLSKQEFYDCCGLKWLEVVLVPSTDSKSAIQPHVRYSQHMVIQTKLYLTMGQCIILRSFKSFMETNEIRSILVTLYHPSSFGQLRGWYRLLKMP